MPKPMLQAKRVYDAVDTSDGLRVLVDRLWPRGVKKESARIDLWVKELTPSNELRKWFHEDRSRIDEFAVRYELELRELADETNAVVEQMRSSEVVTLVTAAREIERSHVRVLRSHLEAWLSADDA